MSYGSRTIIQFGPDDFGLYLSGWHNGFGTPLAVRGTLEQVTGVNVEMKFSGTLMFDSKTGECINTRIDPNTRRLHAQAEPREA